MSSKKKSLKTTPKKNGAMASSRKGKLTVETATLYKPISAPVAVSQVRKGMGHFELKRKSGGGDTDGVYQMIFKRSIGYPGYVANGTYASFSVGLWGESGASRYTLPLDLGFNTTNNDVGMMASYMFSRWRPVAVKLDYIPSSPTTTAGNLAMAIVDASRVPNATNVTVSNTQAAAWGLDWRGVVMAEHSVSTPVWCPASVTRRRNPEDPTWYPTVSSMFPLPGTSATLDTTSVRCWQVTCANVGASTAASFGDFVATYEVELKDVSLSFVNAYQPATYGSSSTTSCGAVVSSEKQDLLSKGLQDAYSRDNDPKQRYDVRSKVPRVVQDVNIVQVGGTTVRSDDAYCTGTLPVCVYGQDEVTGAVALRLARYGMQSAAYGGLMPCTSTGVTDPPNFFTAPAPSTEKAKDGGEKVSIAVRKDDPASEKIPAPPPLVRQNNLTGREVKDCVQCKFPIPIQEMVQHYAARNHCKIDCSASLKGEQCSHQLLPKPQVLDDYVKVSRSDAAPVKEKG